MGANSRHYGHGPFTWRPDSFASSLREHQKFVELLSSPYKFACLFVFAQSAHFFCSPRKELKGVNEEEEESRSVFVFRIATKNELRFSGSVLVIRKLIISRHTQQKKQHNTETMVHHRLSSSVTARVGAAAARRIDNDSPSITSNTSSTSTMWRRYGCRCGSVRWPTWPPMLLLLLLVSVETLSLATVTTATRMHYIHWNTTNPM